MTENQPDVDDDHGLAAEVAHAQEQTWREGLQNSLRGWRENMGMQLNAAVAIDAVFLLVGASAITQATGMLSTAGYIIAGIGLLGLVEKVWRRIR